MILYNLKYIKRAEYFDKYSHQKKKQNLKPQKHIHTKRHKEICGSDPYV